MSAMIVFVFYSVYDATLLFFFFKKIMPIYLLSFQIKLGVCNFFFLLFYSIELKIENFEKKKLDYIWVDWKI